MRPGAPAVCRGTVLHRRLGPKAHDFTYEVTYVWFDPAHPESLTDLHWAWSTGRFRPARVSPDDYGWPEDEPIAEWLGRILGETSPTLEIGEIRFLTQPRRWGWLFNPISLYLIWPPDSQERPTGAVLEVTNTPWKERHHYAVALTEEPPENGSAVAAVGATFAKDLHVSPFLPLDMTYHLRVSETNTPADARRQPALTIAISVSDRAGEVVLETGMNLERRPASSRSLAETLWRDGFTTHRVSAGIHHQAARLLAKGIRFVPHPKRSTRRGSTRHRPDV